jgi:hypothetical protein
VRITTSENVAARVRITAGDGVPSGEVALTRQRIAMARTGRGRWATSARPPPIWPDGLPKTGLPKTGLCPALPDTRRLGLPDTGRFGGLPDTRRLTRSPRTKRRWRRPATRRHPRRKAWRSARRWARRGTRR